MNSNLRIVALAASAASVAALACAPIAAANGEDKFLDELNSLNIALPGKTPPDVIAAGHTTCGELRSGTSVLDEMSAVESRYHFDQGTLFVSAATTNLCPNFAAGSH
jgi:hypothetical protein